jgi:choline dehydrogenase
MRPKSRGYLKLRSNNPRDKPIIDPKLLDNPEDLDDLCNSVALTIEIMAAKSFEPYRKGPYNFDEKMAFNRKALQEWVIENVESAFHCASTCAMGEVTEPNGKVIGLENVRVCDASIMPCVISGNTNATTIMIGEKISDMIRNKSLPNTNESFYIASNWQTHQR